MGLHTAISADLGGRVGWLPKAERVKTLRRPSGAFTCGGGWGGGGGGGGVGGGVGGVSRLRPPKQPFQPPGFHQEVCERDLGGFCGEKAPGPWWAGPQALGARAPSALETWPTGFWGLDPATLTA